MDAEKIKNDKLREKAGKVHQNRLNSIENQSDELRETQLKLEESQRKYYDLYNFAPVGYFTLDNKGFILEVNLAGSALLGVERDKLQKNEFITYIAQKDRNKFHKHWIKVLETGTKQTFELKLLKIDNHSFYSHIEVITVPDENGNFKEFNLTVTDIQDFYEKLRKQGEELSHTNKSLIEIQKRMNRSQEISHLGSWELDIENNVLSWTDEVYRIFGLQPQEFDATYDAFLEAVHPEDREAVDEAYFGSIREGRDTYEIEHRVVRKSTGEVRIVHEKCEHFRDESGKIIRSVGMVQDITERKKAEEALIESEVKFHSLYSSMSEGVAIHEIVYNHHHDAVDYIITDVNQAYEAILGFKKKDVIGKKASELYGIGNPPYLEKFAPVAENGEPIHFETYFEPLDIYFKIKVTSPDKGKFATFFEDITEQKKVEESLHESEERFRNLADNIPNLAWMAEADGWIFWYNKQWYEYTGTTPEEMQGWGWKKAHHPDYLESVTEEWSRSIKEGKPYDNIFPLRSKVGDYHWFLTRVTPIRDDQGKIMRWFGTNTDVTERMDSEEKLKKTMDELKRSNKELQQFAYAASHDLQEPLRMITSFSQLLERRYKDRLDKDAEEFIEFIVEGSQRMKQLIDDLLAYSRVSSMDVKEFEKIDLETILNVVLSNLSVSIKENNAIITHDTLPTVFADESQMVQLFQNLIGNAIKFKGKNKPKIHISTKKDENDWKFGVADNGIGIDPKHQEQIFEVFKRLHTREEYPGTGIGLSIAKKIIQQHGGQIWVESELGKGTTFYFTIPNKTKEYTDYF